MAPEVVSEDLTQAVSSTVGQTVTISLAGFTPHFAGGRKGDVILK